MEDGGRAMSYHIIIPHPASILQLAPYGSVGMVIKRTVSSCQLRMGGFWFEVSHGAIGQGAMTSVSAEEEIKSKGEEAVR